MKYILDTGMGTELLERGINVPDWKLSIWSADALIHDPLSVREIHLANFEAGSNVIITNNYYVTPKYLKERKLRI
jgi:Homocysteine/selenocysteine methylase (S-methylmethionine-dependent)